MGDSLSREAWLAQIERDRKETADYYLDGFDWRGVPPPDEFKGPSYFTPDERWRVAAHLDREAPGSGARIQMDTSVGDLRDFDVFGVFRFTSPVGELALTAYRMVPERAGHDVLFIPFRDATSGKETYGAGRYIDVPRQEDTDDYVLDFNMAYNPSCAYTPRYNCPYPPAENHLKVPVEAGEKVPFHRG